VKTDSDKVIRHSLA